MAFGLSRFLAGASSKAPLGPVSMEKALLFSFWMGQHMRATPGSPARFEDRASHKPIKRGSGAAVFTRPPGPPPGGTDEVSAGKASLRLGPGAA